MDECPLYADPSLYDLLFPAAGAIASVGDEGRRQRLLASERFYTEEAQRSGGRVLELGCGSGRLTIPIAQCGVDITGSDLSASMLQVAREKAIAAGVNVPFVQADMRNFDIPGPFSAVLIPGNSLLHLLTNEDLRHCFACIRRHLAPAGKLIFDISKWDIQTLARDPEPRYPVLTLNDPGRGELTIEETAEYDSAEQVRKIVWYFSVPDAPDFRVIDYQLRVIFPQELLILLDVAGFEVEERYGEFTKEPFSSASPRQVCICSPKS